jgi:hypothetical protein
MLMGLRKTVWRGGQKHEQKSYTITPKVPGYSSCPYILKLGLLSQMSSTQANATIYTSATICCSTDWGVGRAHEVAGFYMSLFSHPLMLSYQYLPKTDLPAPRSAHPATKG